MTAFRTALRAVVLADGCFHNQHRQLDSAAGMVMGGGITGSLNPAGVAKALGTAMLHLGVHDLEHHGFVDAGASDGRIVLCAAALNAKFSFGVELAQGACNVDRRGNAKAHDVGSSSGGVQGFFLYARSKLHSKMCLPSTFVDVIYGQNVVHLPSLSPAGFEDDPFIVYAFCDGWAECDMDGLFAKVGGDARAMVLITSLIGRADTFQKWVLEALNTVGIMPPFAYIDKVVGSIRSSGGAQKTMLVFAR